MLRILLAEADPGARDSIREILRSHSDLELVGLTDDGRKAVAMTSRLRPGLILMGVRLRSMDGVQATHEIMIETPTPILLLSGDHVAGEVDLAVRALGAGALSVISAPALGDERKKDDFVATMKMMAEVKLVRRWRRRSEIGPSEQKADARAATKIVAIGSSTGGPAVLALILSRLPAHFSAPVLIVQHIAPGFVEGVASWLNDLTPLRVAVARHGELAEAGCVYLAPDDRHLGVSRTGRILLSRDLAVDGFRPSASYLFETVGHSFGRNALTVILSGMGRDGVEGLRAARGEGSTVVAQDEATSVVFGMPRAAIEESLADHVLPPEEITKFLIDTVLETQSG